MAWPRSLARQHKPLGVPASVWRVHCPQEVVKSSVRGWAGPLCMGRGVSLMASSGKSPGVVELWAQLEGAGGTVGSMDLSVGDRSHTEELVE